ncbi:hypothetical protein CDO52_19910 [Nocardiopsis gilva YIM 90087]|uniref:Fe/B12 periplasmic-binding domain-containing protein n=1 Tax=Nocardiopsis gilva YIM 90087 TaxID=1235441 RepID=A0A223S9F9_9ACTN|nr:iron-siderophore ABC transporter substrate-binding protein [Nocardiopsis gilva]ASU84765.1 hypothetical protein CDO52_19910 [Nocardiopsis gilva YIM 90087]
MTIPTRLRASARGLLAASAAAVLSLAAACGPAEENAGSDDAASAGYPATVEHHRGETEITSQPKTVVALDPSFVEAAVALEMDVVGRVVYADPSEKLPEYLGEEGEKYAGDAEVLGTLQEPDLAKIAELQPDLIVSADIRHADLYDRLSKIAPTVFSETTGATWKDNVLLLGDAVGKRDLADEKIGDYEKRAKALGKAIEKKYDGDVPTMSLTRFVGEPTVRLYSTASFPGIVQNDVGLPRPKGAPNTEDEISVDLSQEEILDLDADRIFVSTWQGDEEAGKKAEVFQGNPLWDKLKGEKHNVDDDVWYTSVSLQGAEGILDDLSEVYGVDA